MNLSSYINLCKPKIVALLTVTALIGMLLSVNFSLVHELFTINNCCNVTVGVSYSVVNQ